MYQSKVFIKACLLRDDLCRNDCKEACYNQWTVIWKGNFKEDDASVAVEITQAYLTWVGSVASKYWSSYSGQGLGTVNTQGT